MKGADVTATFTMLDMEMQQQEYSLPQRSEGAYARANVPALVMVGRWGVSFNIIPRAQRRSRCYSSTTPADEEPDRDPAEAARGARRPRVRDRGDRDRLPALPGDTASDVRAAGEPGRRSRAVRRKHGVGLYVELPVASGRGARARPRGSRPGGGPGRVAPRGQTRAAGLGRRPGPADAAGSRCRSTPAPAPPGRAARGATRASVAQDLAPRSSRVSIRGTEPAAVLRRLRPARLGARSVGDGARPSGRYDLAPPEDARQPRPALVRAGRDDPHGLAVPGPVPLHVRDPKRPCSRVDRVTPLGPAARARLAGVPAGPDPTAHPALAGRVERARPRHVDAAGTACRARELLRPAAARVVHDRGRTGRRCIPWTST